MRDQVSMNMEPNQPGRTEQPRLSRDEQFRLAVNLARQGQWLPSRAVLQGLVERKEDDPQIWLWLAASYRSDPARLRVLRFALQRHPGNPLLEKALAAQQRSMAQQPDSSTVGPQLTPANLEPAEASQTVPQDEAGSLADEPDPAPQQPAAREDPRHVQVDAHIAPVDQAASEDAPPAQAIDEPGTGETQAAAPPEINSPTPDAAAQAPELADRDLSAQPAPPVSLAEELFGPLPALQMETLQEAVEPEPAEPAPAEMVPPPPASRSETRMMITAAAVIVLIILIAFLWAHYT
jgi:hypothetical protein